MAGLKKIEVKLGSCDFKDGNGDYYPVLGWAYSRPSRGMFSREKVEADNFNENLKPLPVYTTYENFGSRFHCKIGQICYVPDFDMDDNGIIGREDVMPFMKFIFYTYDLGDWTIFKFTHSKLEREGCHVVQYDDSLLDPKKDLFQGCFDFKKRKMWTDGKYMWVGPVGNQSSDFCGGRITF
jgi:hypothetical protein